MELTIVLSVPQGSEDYDLLNTLESLPWSESGVDLIVYSEDTKKIKEIISGSDLLETVKSGEMEVVFCETPESNHHTIGLEDTKTEEVMFLEAGDIIEDFQGDILVTGCPEPIGIPGIGQDGVPETIRCHECRMLPESYRGMIFKAQWLRDNNLTPDNLGFTARVCDKLRSKLDSPEYWGSWSDLDISDSLSVSRIQDDDTSLIETLQETWRNGGHSYSPYIRDLVWGRIMTCAANLIPDTSEIKAYLYPAQKLAVLK